MINKKSILIVFILIILSLTIVAIMPNYSYAMDSESGGAIGTGDSKNPTINPEFYNPTKNPISNDDLKPVTDKAGVILGAINVIGIVVAVIVIIIIGIKYMIGSVQEKADYKKTMIPYIVGAFMLASITTIINIFAGIITDISGSI